MCVCVSACVCLHVACHIYTVCVWVGVNVSVKCECVWREGYSNKVLPRTTKQSGIYSTCQKDGRNFEVLCCSVFIPHQKKR